MRDQPFPFGHDRMQEVSCTRPINEWSLAGHAKEGSELLLVSNPYPLNSVEKILGTDLVPWLDHLFGVGAQPAPPQSM